jgi:hypothetical protein
MSIESTIFVAIYAFTFWLGLHLVSRSKGKWSMRLAGLGSIAYAFAVASEILIYKRSFFAILTLIMWSAASLMLFRRSNDARHPIGALVVGVLLFTLSVGLLMLDLFPRNLMIAAVGFDILILCSAIASLDAFDEGELFAPDFVRSLLASMTMSLTFGGAVFVAAQANGGLTSPLVYLMLGVIALAIATQVLTAPIQSLFDWFAFARSPKLQQARAELRETSEALPRMNEIAGLNDADFERYARRALSNLGDLSKLMANPLTQLPQVNDELRKRGLDDAPLNRAIALKTVLHDYIARLKPDTNKAFGTSDEWRYYNALHFPYVVGLKPYSTRAQLDLIDPTHRAALSWFQTNVPERTLHNWQNAAAKLIASELRSNT